MPFEPGNTLSTGRPPKEKSFANMLNIAIKEANEQGGTKLRQVVDALVARALSGDVQAIKEVADRLDGKVPQAIGGDEDMAAIKHAVSVVERLIVDHTPDSDSSGIPPAT
jgi:hypothetical protein